MFSYKRFLLKNTVFICVTFTVLFTVTFYWFQFRSQKALYTDNAKIYADQLKSKLDSTVYTANDLAVIFHSNDDFQNYVESSEITPYTRRQISLYMYSTINSMPSISSRIYITKPQDEYLISSESVMTQEYFASIYGIPYENIAGIIAETKMKVLPEPAVFFSNESGSDYFISIIKDNRSFKQPYLIISVIKLNTLADSIPFNAELLISTEKQTVFLNSSMSDAEKKEASGGRIPSRYTALCSNTYSSSPAGAVSYTLIVKRSDLFFSINRYIYYIIPLGVLFFILTYMFSRIMVNRAHKPIRGILEQVSRIDPQEQQNEIEIISSAITLLSNRNKSLLDVVDANNAELRTKFINDLLYDRLPKARAEFGINSYLKEYSNALPLSLIIISIENYDSDAVQDNSTDAATFYSVVKAIFQQAFSDADFFHFTSLPPSTYCVLISVPDKEDLRARLQDIFLMAETDIGINMLATIGDDVNSWDALSDVFSSTHLSHLSAVSRNEPYSIVNTDELDISFFYSSELDEQMYNACIRSDKQVLGQSINVLVNKNFPTEQLFAVNRAPLSILLYALSTHILTTLKLDEKAVFDEQTSIYLELNSCTSAPEFYRKCMTVFNTIIDYNAGIRSDYESTYCDKMLSFVHDNYMNNISLQDIAAYMNMSQAYVSRLFKKLVHTNFKDYLTKVRLDNAAKLLIDKPGKTVQEVASACGFNTTRTFTNAFSSAFGMTPTEYRHKHLR